MGCRVPGVMLMSWQVVRGCWDLGYDRSEFIPWFVCFNVAVAISMFVISYYFTELDSICICVVSFNHHIQFSFLASL